MPRRNLSDYQGLWRSEIQNHYRTQKSLKEQRPPARTALHNFRDFLTINLWGWVYHYIKSRFGGKHPFEDYSKSNHNGIFKMPTDKKIKVVVAADWGTDTFQSDRIGKCMDKEEGDFTIHLGDTYYVGAPVEIESNFLIQGNSWPRGKYGTLAIPGNHEFYSNGNGFFEKLLPHMFVKIDEASVGQSASFFCLENSYWRILGLDTGYYSVGKPILEWINCPDAHLDNLIIDWLKNEVKLNKNEKRGLVLLTHHQYCSSFGEEQFTKPGEQLKDFLDENEVIWLWGHEHRFAVYGKYQSKNGITAYGRCIGHGGMPIEIASKKSTPTEKNISKYNLVFYDKRYNGMIDKTPIGHNGYSVLNFEKNRLVIEYKDELTWLFKEEWEVDNATGKIKGIHVNNNPNVSLNLASSSFSDAIQ